MQKQLEWEAECQRRGEQRYFDQQDATRDKGNELTDGATFLLKERLVETAKLIKSNCKRGAAGYAATYDRLVRQAADGDYVKLAYIGVKVLLCEVQMGKKLAATKFISVVGGALETELKCKLFEEKYPEYFGTVMKSLNEGDVTSASHKQKVLMKKFTDFNIEWSSWSAQVRGHVGMRILKCLLQVFDDLVFMHCEQQARKRIYLIDTTVDFDEWIAKFEQARGLLYPARLPLKIPPQPWSDNNFGGYYTPKLMLPFVKVRGSAAREFVERATPTHHKRAVNKLQRTAWRINNNVLKVQEEVFRRNLRIGVPSSQPVLATQFPPHLADVDREILTEAEKDEVTAWKILRKKQYDTERKRKGQVIGFRQAHLLAKELRDWDKFYFAYNCDFRGRIYCATSGLSPQGSDAAKGLLHFATGVKLGASGVRWLAIHGANTFGEDKISYDDRVKWIHQNKDLIQAIVDDPIANQQWSSADKPYQFLAFCYEWANCDYGRNSQAVSYIPVGLDGSCNGLQHYSALLKDEVGAKATNLTKSEKPEDIYGEVARVTTEKLKVLAEEGDPLAKVWLTVSVSRKLTKRPVMTLPYGAKVQSAREAIYSFCIENWQLFNLPEDQQWIMAKYLTPIVWESIGDVVIAPRRAMAWLRARMGKDYCSWMTILGFPVYQSYKTNNTSVVRTYLHGRLELHVPDMEKGEPSPNLQRNGVAPNFVHSLDSTHMVLTINASDFNSYAMIHDDFGTHAGNIDQLFKTIRKAFKYMYTKYDILEHWANQQGVSSKAVKRGTYDVDNVMSAPYFFG